MAEPEIFPCSACGFRVHHHPPGSGERCPVCGWFDDFEQLVHPDLTYGANSGTSLRQAQAAAADVVNTGGGPGAEFVRDKRWRPLRPGEIPAADPGGPSSPVCSVGTPDPEGYVPYWLRSG
jgi:hypothetical protein